MDQDNLKNVVEAALLAAGRPLGLDELQGLFDDADRPDRPALRGALDVLVAEYEGRGIRLLEVASGWRVQIRSEYSDWLSRLWQERPPRYSRALLETLALVAYRQPITRGEIEDIRGVSVISNIVRTLQERGWIRVVGHRDVPGKPEMFGTTKEFLDYFGLKRLDELPTLAEIRDLDSINVELDFGPEMSPVEAGEAANEETPDVSGPVALDASPEERAAGESAEGPKEAPEHGAVSGAALGEAMAEDLDAEADEGTARPEA